MVLYVLTYTEVPRSTNPSNDFWPFAEPFQRRDNYHVVHTVTTACSAAYAHACMLVNVQLCSLGAWNLENGNWKLDVRPQLL